MKITKRAYVKVWQNCPEDEHEDTTITLYDYEDANELNSIPVSLLYLLECHASVNSMNEIQRPRILSYSRIVRPHRHQNNRADILRTLKLKTETQPTFNLTESNQ